MAGDRKRLAFLGPAGTFSEGAALLHDAEAERIPLASERAVAAAVETDMADEGVLAIENSIEGSVPATLDLLIHDSRLVIRRELVLPIEHCLVARPGTQVSAVRVVFSHPQALGQCRRFIESCFPAPHSVTEVAALSTAEAVQQMMSHEQPAAAIAPRRAAELYGADVLARGVQDQPNNQTRFVVLAASDADPTGDDKTSLCFSFDDDRPGLLVSVLREFSERGINLTKVESRPAKTELGSYYFLVDLQGHRADPAVAEVLEAVQRHTGFFKVFGSYPRFAG